MDDTHMMDVDGDISLDVEPRIEEQMFQTYGSAMDADAPPHTNNTNNTHGADAPVPAAYFESLDTFSSVPDTLNLQGVSDFGPDEPLDYVMEFCPERRPRGTRWINDNSVNIEYYSPGDAADALFMLTHPEAGVAAIIPSQTARRGQPYSKKPNSVLMVREANIGDRKARDAAERSDYYRKNPQARERDQARRRERGQRERPETPPVILDYGDGDDGVAQNGRRNSIDEGMRDDYSSPDRNGRGRQSYQRDQGHNSNNRDNRDVDSYRPGSTSARESKFGRLRDRSASPDGGDDGRLGFSDDGRLNHNRYRSRSRGDRRRRRSPSRERQFRKHDGPDLQNSKWEKDRYDPVQEKEPRYTSYGPTSPMSHHRRSDAHDETNNKGSLLSRMTKDGKPVLPAAPRSLASRMTRVDDSDSSYERAEPHYTPRETSYNRRDTSYNDREPSYQKREPRAPNYGRRDNNYSRGEPSYARGEESNYGRLKDDDSAPREDSFQEAASGRAADIADRITWKRDGGNTDNRRASVQKDDSGISIRGTAATQTHGFSIRGAAGGG